MQQRRYYNFIGGVIVANIVNMPQIGLNETSNLISIWNKEVGDSVNVGEVLFSIETDKSSMEVESEFEGILLKKLYDDGDVCDVLTPVCIIGEEGEDISGFLNEEIPEEKVQCKQMENTRAESHIRDSAPIINEDKDGVLRISPRARNLGGKRGVNLEYAIGTGPEGRIIERDIYSLLENGPITTKAAGIEKQDKDLNSIEATGIGGRILTDDTTEVFQDSHDFDMCKEDYKIVKFTNIRKIIAKNMMNSLQNTAQLSLNASFDATSILNYRKIIKSSPTELELGNITLNDMILYAVSRTVVKFEYLNANIIGNDEIKIFSNVHLGFACDTDKGLMVPTIFNANTLSLNEISAVSKELAVNCKQGNIHPQKLQGATFTISNLGSFGIENFTPVINPPQTAILGVGTIEYKIRKGDGGYEEYPSMFLSLTFDHRAIDGAPAAKFLQLLKENLENFTLLLAK